MAFLLSTYQQVGERSVLAAGATVSELEVYCEFLAVDSYVERNVIRLQDMQSGQAYTVRLPERFVKSFVAKSEFNVTLERVKRTTEA